MLAPLQTIITMYVRRTYDRTIAGPGGRSRKKTEADVVSRVGLGSRDGGGRRSALARSTCQVRAADGEDGGGSDPSTGEIVAGIEEGIAPNPDKARGKNSA
jgi:hypothetical protein